MNKEAKTLKWNRLDQVPKLIIEWTSDSTNGQPLSLDEINELTSTYEEWCDAHGVGSSHT